MVKIHFTINLPHSVTILHAACDTTLKGVELNEADSSTKIDLAAANGFEDINLPLKLLKGSFIWIFSFNRYGF
jgi:hypothetical protein